MTARARTTLLTCLLGLAASACGGGSSEPAPVPAPASVAVTVSAVAPLVNTPVTIRARVLTAAGTPVAAGTAVGFAAAGGTISDVTATDAAGDATARLTSAAHGAVTVIVTVGSLPARTQAISFIDPDEPHAVELSADAAVADVGTTVRLVARVTPVGTGGIGDPAATIADGTVVTFTASAGTLSDVTTTVGGQATARLGGLATPALVFVTASAGSVESLPVLVEFTDSTVPASVTLTGTPSAGATDDQGPVALTATVLTLSGSPVPVGTPVAFAVVAGAGTLSAADGRTDAAGRVSVTLRSAVEGAVTVTATAAGGVTGTLTTPFANPSKAVAISVSASPTSGRIDGQGPVLLTATVTPADPVRGRIPDGTPVAFTITTGSGTLSSPTVPTAGGVASVALASGAEGSVTVRATAGALADAVTVTFTNPSRPAAISLLANPPAGRLDGQGPVTLTATLAPADPALGSIADGTAVTFTVMAGSGALSSLAAVTASGVAAVTLSSAVEGSVTVRAAAGQVSDAVTVTFTNPSRPAALALFANPPSGRLDGQGPVTLTATVTPADQALGRIADGTPVSFAVVAGTATLSASSATTTSGVASVTLSGAAEGNVTVRATAAGTVVGTATVAFTNPSKPVALALSANPPAGRLDGQGPVTLTATVTPADQALGRIADGTPVTFAITSGSGALSAASATTTNGLASVTLSSAAEGIVSVRATVAGTVVGTATVAFTNPSRPVALSLTASPSAARLDGQGPVTLIAAVTPADPALGAIAEGTPVAFVVTSGAGTLSAGSALTAGGVAVVTLTGGAEGTVAIRATVAGTVAGTATVTFTNPSRPVALALSANPPAGRLDGQGPVTLTATVTPADPVVGRVADGTPVAFTVTSGSGTLSAASATTTNGVASVALTGGAEGSVAVRATVAGTVEGAVTVPFSNPSKPAAVSLTASPGTGKAGGLGPVTLTATVMPADQVLGRVADGTPVTFTITSGAGTLSAASAATAGGVAAVVLDAPAAGTVTVTASAGSAPTVTSPPVAVPFVLQPTVAIVTVRTTGTLPAGTAIGGVSALVTVSPSAGLALSAADVAATGAASGSLLAANVADVAADRLALISAAGFQPGEFATLTFRVAPGTFPTAQDFAVALTGPGVIDLDGQTLPLGVAIQSVAIQ